MKPIVLAFLVGCGGPAFTVAAVGQVDGADGPTPLVASACGTCGEAAPEATADAAPAADVAPEATPDAAPEACAPIVCHSDSAAHCGDVSDGCGATLQCGECAYSSCLVNGPAPSCACWTNRQIDCSSHPGATGIECASEAYVNSIFSHHCFGPMAGTPTGYCCDQ